MLNINRALSMVFICMGLIAYAMTHSSSEQYKNDLTKPFILYASTNMSLDSIDLSTANISVVDNSEMSSSKSMWTISEENTYNLETQDIFNTDIHDLLVEDF